MLDCLTGYLYEKILNIYIYIYTVYIESTLTSKKTYLLSFKLLVRPENRALDLNTVVARAATAPALSDCAVRPVSR